MDIKQLQYFVVSVNMGSFHTAAEALITSQPNVSKVVKALEGDLNMKLLERDRYGVRVTPDGEVIYRYAVNVLKNFQMIHERKDENKVRTLSICKIPGIELDSFAAEFCSLHNNRGLRLHYQEKCIEEIMIQVHRRNSELGFLYMPKKNLIVFEGQLKGKGLFFCELAKTPLYLFAGPHNECYERQQIKEQAIQNMKIVQQNEDMYSMHHQLPYLRDGSVYKPEKSSVTYTNSNHFLIQLLKNTDYGSVGSGLIKEKYEEYGIRAIPIKGYEECVSFGYLRRTRGELSSVSQGFIKFVKDKIEKGKQDAADYDT